MKVNAEMNNKKAIKILNGWEELKETIIELRDNEGTCTQKEVCTFLVNLMNVIENGENLKE